MAAAVEGACAGEPLVVLDGGARVLPASAVFIDTGTATHPTMEELDGLVRYTPELSAVVLAPPTMDPHTQNQKQNQNHHHHQQQQQQQQQQQHKTEASDSTLITPKEKTRQPLQEDIDEDLRGLTPYSPELSLSLSLNATRPHKADETRGGVEDSESTETLTMYTLLAPRSVDLTLSLQSGDAPVHTATVRFQVTAPGLDVIPFAELELGSSGPVSSGGFSTVWRARYKYDDVAVKVITQLLTLGHIQSFVEEIGVLSSLRHSNIVFLVGIVTEANSAAIVMEYMAGGDLRAALHGSNRLPLETATKVRIVIDILRGLAYLHSHGLPHRDLKPANILLLTTSPLILNAPLLPVRAKLADFGLSGIKQASSGSSLACTVRYAAPEVLLGKLAGSSVDPSLQAAIASDVYSLGLVVIETLTSVKPFAHLGPEPNVRFDNVYVAPFAEDTLDVALIVLDNPHAFDLVMGTLDSDPGQRPSCPTLLAALHT